MIKRYSYGTPFKTEGLVVDFPIETGKVPYLEEVVTYNFESSDAIQDQSILVDMESKQSEDTKQTGRVGFSYHLDKDTIIYGLGENVRGINKRGWTYTSYANDDPSHIEGIKGLYAAHNFIIVDGKERFGLFFDYPGELKFDIGYTKYDEMTIIPEDLNIDVYVIEGESLKDIVKEFRKAIGRSYIAPRWALGYGQSRWGYENKDDIEAVVKGYRENHIPLDMVYMDIDYMVGYRNFTVDEKAFPKFDEFVQEMKKEKIHLIPIIDAGVKSDKGYVVDDEGVENNYFCKDEDGEDFVGYVWPGEVHFPDFLNPKAREWFGNYYHVLLDKGIDGFWNDMNEPAIFFSKKQMDALREETKEKLMKGEMSNKDFEGLRWGIDNLKNARADYKAMYHNVDGKMVCHDKVHNLYGYNMTRAAGEAFERLRPEERILMFSRSSCTGMHRYGGVWTGDNSAWWAHLKMNLTMLPGLSMQGFLYSGADIGGFAWDTTEDLLLRWIGLSLFTPLMRNHSAKGTRQQEAYLFGDKDAFRRLIGLRYYLLPYIYSEYMKACLNDEMLFRPLSFDYENDPHASQVEDQLLFGDGIMIAPVLTQNATGRYVYLPEDMKMVRFRSGEDFDEEIMEKGHHYVNVALDEVILFIRSDKLIVMSKGGEHSDEVDFENVNTLSYVKTKAVYQYYHDDGCGKDYENPKNIREIVLNK